MKLLKKLKELNIERYGSFGKDTYNNNFRYTTIHDFVVLTPDYNIYPCFFLAEEGNEIGKYDNGKIMLYDEYKEEWDGCLTTRICNDEDYRIENHKLIIIKKQ